MAAPTIATGRDIGPWGTAARAVVGAAMISGAILIGVDTLDALLGLVVFPLAVTVALAARGRDASPLRLMGPGSYCLNCVIGVATLIIVPGAALLFYGGSSLLAAMRGYAGCELFAVSNWLRRRDDQIACPLMSPIDAAEGRGCKVKVTT